MSAKCESPLYLFSALFFGELLKFLLNVLTATCVLWVVARSPRGCFTYVVFPFLYPVDFTPFPISQSLNENQLRLVFPMADIFGVPGFRYLPARVCDDHLEELIRFLFAVATSPLALSLLVG